MPFPSAARLHALVMNARHANAQGVPRQQGLCIDLDGQPCVIKWAQRQPWARVRSWLAALACWLAFGERVRPSAVRAGNIEHEARRLRQLLDAGQRVPHVLLQEEDCLVLRGVGVSLDRVVPQLPAPEKIALLERIADDLADWHNHGQWHGGAQLRNVTLHQGQLYRIDFEERHGHALSFPATCTYDLLLFFGDAFTHLDAQMLIPQGCSLARRYLDQISDVQQRQVRERLWRLQRLLQVLVWVDRCCPSLTRRRDKQRVVRFARVMQAMLATVSLPFDRTK